MSITRRDFLTNSTLASAGIFLKKPMSVFHAISNDDDQWYLQMRRVGQHNFNEYDPRNLDIDSWVDYWADLKVHAMILTGGGFIAMYPTKIADHYKSQFLDNRDLFGDYLKALKKRNIRVLARIETNYLHKDIFKLRPEWFERNPDGSPREHSETPWVYRSCLFSNYRNDQVPKIIKELASMYEVDGFFTNSWPQVDRAYLCSCENCKKLGNLDQKQITEKYLERTLDTISLINQTVKQVGGNKVYNVNIDGGIHAVQDLQKIGGLASWITTDHQGRGGTTAIWDCSQQGKVALAVMKGKPVTNVVAVKTGPWRHSSNSDEETTLWMAQTTASGMIPWLVYLGGELPDKRWRETGRKYYQWLEKNEKHFFNKRSLSRIAVVFSQKLNEYYKAPGPVPGGYGGEVVNPNLRGNPSDYLQGVYYALVEARIPFDLVHENDLDLETLSRYDGLIMPNTALLSDTQSDNLKRYVQNGGSILATFETGLYDEWGNARSEYVLANIFDIHLKPGYQGPKGQIFYANIDSRHEILNGFGDTDRLPGGEYYVPVSAPGKHLLTVVPPYPNGIPEMVYAHPRKELSYEGQHSDNPAMVIREKGKSRLVYFPTDIDKNIWLRGSTDLSKLFQQSVKWMMKGETGVKVQGEGTAEVFAWETKPGFAIHVLNYNNPNMSRPSLRKYYRIGEQKVSMELPLNSRITKVELLRKGTLVPFKQAGNTIEFTIPSIEDFEVAALYKS
ncbi:MAG TPA: alpha-amylase family protein [Flavisolibacter sp.]|jgi:hypothetical protein|nr:alpha-amylase family protein [Flavisolibacter sp.]